MPAVHGPFLRAWGQEATIDIVLYDRGAVDFDGGIVAQDGDVRLVIDGGTAVQAAHSFVPNNGGYSLSLTPLEMQSHRIAAYVVDLSTPKRWVDTLVTIETYGDVNSQHPSLGNAALIVPA